MCKSIEEWWSFDHQASRASSQRACIFGKSSQPPCQNCTAVLLLRSSSLATVVRFIPLCAIFTLLLCTEADSTTVAVAQDSTIVAVAQDSTTVTGIIGMSGYTTSAQILSATLMIG